MAHEGDRQYGNNRNGNGNNGNRQYGNNRNGNNGYARSFSDGLGRLTTQFFRTMEGALGEEKFANAFGSEQFDLQIGDPADVRYSKVQVAESHSNSRESTSGKDTFTWWGGIGNLDDAGVMRADRVKTPMYFSLGYDRDASPEYRKAMMDAIAEIVPARSGSVRLVSHNHFRVDCQKIDDDRKVTVARFVLAELLMVCSSKGSVAIQDFMPDGTRVSEEAMPAKKAELAQARETRPQAAAATE